MKTIELTDEQYRMLTKLVFIGEWVLNANHVEPPFEEESELSKVIYNHCDKFNTADMFNKFDYGEIEMKDEQVMDILPIVEDFVEYNFWPKLSMHLATRDLIEAGALIEDVEKREEVLMGLTDQYLDILSEDGVINLRLVEEEEPPNNLSILN